MTELRQHSYQLTAILQTSTPFGSLGQMRYDWHASTIGDYVHDRRSRLS